ncbi:MAG TPA: FkbM family methyltransferase [Bacteriovoracaceae bacterium]|nr:FkbM family methyltransferase [Bacteriovoracaceae bacterium]
MIKTFVKLVIPARLWNKVRLARQRKLLLSFKKYQINRNIAGHDLKIQIADPLGKGWYDQDWEKLPEVEFLKKYTLKPGAKVFDLGAHQGVVALVLGKEVSPGGKVIALEANLHNSSIAIENVKLNKAEACVNIVHAAISNEMGEIVFNEGLNGKVDDGQGEWGQVKTKALTIDHLCEVYGTPDLIFLDVEGFEMNAMNGASKSFNLIPSWFIEVHSDYQLQSFGSKPEEVLARFPKDLYKLFVSNDNAKTFVSYEEKLHLEFIQKRFFLIALKR